MIKNPSSSKSWQNCRISNHSAQKCGLCQSCDPERASSYNFQTAVHQHESMCIKSIHVVLSMGCMGKLVSRNKTWSASIFQCPSQAPAWRTLPSALELHYECITVSWWGATPSRCSQRRYRQILGMLTWPRSAVAANIRGAHPPRTLR